MALPFRQTPHTTRIKETALQTPRIGMIGLGLMGLGIATNIVQKGFALTAMSHAGNQPLDDLLKAFEQDVTASANAWTYADMNDLLRYCELSANPVGRLLLHLYGVHDETSLAHSDAICSALQLINFWQDLSEDIPRGRYYLPQDQAAKLSDAELLAFLCQHAHQLMMSGAPLVHRVPGRAGWELRLVVQGGMRILEKVRQLGPQALHTRPRLRPWDLPLMFWRSLWM